MMMTMIFRTLPLRPNTASIMERTDTQAVFTLTAVGGIGSGNFDVDLTITEAGDFIHTNVTDRTPTVSIARSGDTEFPIKYNE